MEYSHEELNEQQKEEIEKQLTLEQRIQNGEVVEVVTTVPEIVGRADSSSRIDAIQSPLPPHPQFRTSIVPYGPQPSNNHILHNTSPITSITAPSFRSLPAPHYTTQLPNRAHTIHPPSTPFGANTGYQHAIFIPGATVPTVWKRPLTPSIIQSLTSSEQPYRENNNAHLQSTNDLSHNRQYPSNASSNIPYPFRGHNNNSYYRKDTTGNTAAHLRQELQNFKVHLNNYENKFKAPGETSPGDAPNNSSSQ
jgi:hypothetical protein